VTGSAKFQKRQSPLLHVALSNTPPRASAENRVNIFNYFSLLQFLRVLHLPASPRVSLQHLCFCLFLDLHPANHRPADGRVYLSSSNEAQRGACYTGFYIVFTTRDPDFW
jgi:hypothetical protein